MQTFKSLSELEQARLANIHADLPLCEKASTAEKLGDYRTARKLWQQVVNTSKKKSLQQFYAEKRHQFCHSAAIHHYQRPELRHLNAQMVERRIANYIEAQNVK